MLRFQKLDPNIPTPHYAHATDAGLDLYSAEEYHIQPKQKLLISTAIKMAIPSGHVGLIWDKSGLAAKHSLKTMAGVVDSGYRGEVKIVLVNLGDDVYHVQKYAKIAQMLIQPIIQFPLEEVSSLEESDRGEGGFGSTGMFYKGAEH